MLAYDVVALMGIDANSLGDYGREMLRDFVRAGGTLLVCGGFYAYGEGGYSGTQFDDLLPFKAGGPFTLQPVSGQKLLKLSEQATAFSSLEWKQHPVCFWAHQVAMLPDSEPLIMIGKQPFLAQRRVGKGQVFAIAGTVLGGAAKGGTAFWEWESWPKLTEGLLTAKE